MDSHVKGGRVPTVNWDAWAALLRDVARKEARLRFDPDEERFYRGHVDASWTLLPTLMRRYGREQLPEAENDLFWEFQARARELHNLHLSDWDILFFMRHHGAPTRLLDWTETLGVALYFALEDYFFDRPVKREHPCIWMLNPYLLNGGGKRAKDDLWSPKRLGWNGKKDRYHDYGELVLEGDWWWRRPLAIYPQQKPLRMGAQRGWFTIHGQDPRPLETQCPNCVSRVDIPQAAIPATLEVLRIAGVDPYSINADLDGLALSLVLKNTPLVTSARRRLKPPKKRK
jgi:hypothetical protein